ncbi:MAG: tetratricopeptide repeat protein [Bacteroidales bacterium]|nr:tetratricopeptide repeat protein [Bacteroidales bacterium]
MTAIAAALLLAAFADAYADQPGKTYSDAVALYEQGMFNRAAQMFGSLGSYADAEAYSALCRLRMHSPEGGRLVEKVADSPLKDLAWFHYGVNLFADGDYAASARALDKVNGRIEKGPDAAEYLYKRGYCDYALGLYQDAERRLMKVEALAQSDYTAPSRYLVGTIKYLDRNFAEAEKWFALSGKDRRFADLSAFYIVDCRFAAKDYDYVVENGIPLLENAPAERRAHLGRVISEAYLVKGDPEKAREFLEGAQSLKKPRTRTDFFYAGSVMYALGDYEGAIENFEAMEDGDDSLAQVAAYELADSYIRTGNKIAAMASFKKASELPFVYATREDAFFNYAKLAFDLNGDTSVFKEYARIFETSGKGQQIYEYMALAALYDKDYAAALDAYSQLDELSAGQKSNYMRANYLRGRQLVEGGSYRDAVMYLKAAAFYAPRHDVLGHYARFNAADCLFRTGNVDEALSIYQDLYNLSALDNHDEGRTLAYNIAYCYLEKGRWKDAALWLDRYLSSRDLKFREDALVRRADCDFVRQKYADAVVSYGRAISEYGSPDKIYPYYRQALAYGLKGDLKSKVEVLSRVDGASPDAPMWSEAQYELARAEFERGNASSAERTFLKILSGNASREYEAGALTGLGMVCRNSGRYEDALVRYKTVVEQYADLPAARDALLAIESIYQTLGRPDAYLAYSDSVETVVKKTPEEREELYFNTIEQLYVAGRWKEVRDASLRFTDSYASSGRLRDVNFYLAESLRCLGEEEAACDCYGKVFESGAWDSFREMAALQYARISFKLERYADALAGYSELEKGAEMEQNRLEAATGVMRSAYRAREFGLAAETSARIAEQPGRKVEEVREALMVNARSNLAQSRREEALQALNRLAADPSTDEGGEACVMLVKDAFDRGDFKGVETMVYALSGKAGVRSFHLAKAYVILGDSFVSRGSVAQAKATFESIRDGYVPSGESDEVTALVRDRLNSIEKMEENEQE